MAQAAVCTGMSAPAISRAGKPAAASGRVKRDEHPLGQLGGYQMPSFGAIGGAKGVGVQGNAATQTKKRAAEHSHTGTATAVLAVLAAVAGTIVRCMHVRPV